MAVLRIAFSSLQAPALGHWLLALGQNQQQTQQPQNQSRLNGAFFAFGAVNEVRA